MEHFCFISYHGKIVVSRKAAIQVIVLQDKFDLSDLAGKWFRNQCCTLKSIKQSLLQILTCPYCILSMWSQAQA